MDAPVHEVKDLSVENLRRQIAESRALLGNWLQLYEIHSATIESGVLDDAEVLDELDRHRSQGLAIGLTVTGPRQADVIRRALDVRVNGSNPFGVVQATWNLLEPSAGAALADAKASGWGVIVKEALANGRLTDRAGRDTAALKSFAAARQTTVDVAAIAAVLAQPWVDVVLSGAVTTQQLASNLQALDMPVDQATDWPTIAEPPPEYWSRRGALEWR
jgi:aryl-alcohol dehydrogenase-like predicted oxidoreductase